MRSPLATARKGVKGRFGSLYSPGTGGSPRRRYQHWLRALPPSGSSPRRTSDNSAWPTRGPLQVKASTSARLPPVSPAPGRRQARAACRERMPLRPAAAAVKHQVYAAVRGGATDLLDRVTPPSIGLADESLEVLPAQCPERVEPGSGIKQSSATITDKRRSARNKYERQREHPRHAIQALRDPSQKDVMPGERRQKPLDADIDDDRKNDTHPPR